MSFVDDLLKKSGPGVLVGIGVAVLAPVLAPVLATALRPVLKTAIKSGILLYEKGREVGVELTENLEDLVAEVKSELDVENQATTVVHELSKTED